MLEGNNFIIVLTAGHLAVLIHSYMKISEIFYEGWDFWEFKN